VRCDFWIWHSLTAPSLPTWMSVGGG